MIKVVNPIKNNDCSSNIKDFEVPKFSKAAGAEKIYERDGYIILRVKRGYIVYNTRKRFENGHTHIQSFSKSPRPGKQAHFTPLFHQLFNQSRFIHIVKVISSNFHKIFHSNWQFSQCFHTSQLLFHVL